MLRTFSGRRCDAGRVSGSASAASSSSAARQHDQCGEHPVPRGLQQHRRAKRRRDHRRDAEHQHQPRHHGGRDGVGEQVADDGDGHHHRCGGAHALQSARHAEHGDVRREQAQQRRQHVQHDAGHQRPAAAQRVRQRADDQLAEGQPGERAGERQLRDRRGHRQVVGDLGQRGQIHVDGQRAQRDQGAEDRRSCGRGSATSTPLPGRDSTMSRLREERKRGWSRPRRSMLPWKWLAPLLNNLFPYLTDSDRDHDRAPAGGLRSFDKR